MIDTNYFCAKTFFGMHSIALYQNYQLINLVEHFYKLGQLYFSTFSMKMPDKPLGKQAAVVKIHKLEWIDIPTCKDKMK